MPARILGILTASTPYGTVAAHPSAVLFAMAALAVTATEHLLARRRTLSVGIGTLLYTVPVNVF